MKKRIISLILVVAMMFLTLTGCAFNYAKDDMSKYTTFKTDAFLKALQELKITDGDFGTDEEARKAKVQDAIAAAILKVTDATDKKFAGKVDNFDSLAFCYFAMDEEGHIFYTSKMDASKPTSIQLGLSTLDGLNKAVADKVITVEDLAEYIYVTSSLSLVGDGDAVSISYVKSHTEGEGEAAKTVTDETVDNKYVIIDAKNAFHALLIGAQVGVDLGSFTVEESKTEGEGENAVTTTTEYTYSDVKIESVAKDNSTAKVADGDIVFVSYTKTYETWEGFELPEDSNGKIDADGNYSETVTYGYLYVQKDAEPEQTEGEETPEKVVTFAGSLVDKTVGSTTSSIKVKEEVAEGHNVDVTYKNVKVHWTLESESEAIEVKYTPYEEALKEDKSNKKVEKDIYGKEVTLNGVELTYAVFPVYYLDVENTSAELILREFYSTVASTETIEHDENEEHDHDAMTEYVFDTLNDKEYKNGDKTLEALVKELVELYKTHTTEDEDVTDALKALNTAQSNRAKYTGKSDSEIANLDKKITDAHKTYADAKVKLAATEKKVDEKIAAILGCKKGETSVEAGLVADYEKYQYDTLEAAYKSDLKNKLAKEIIALAKANITYDKLPKRAVKDAKKAILNTYKNKFYEGNYTTSTSSSTSNTATETNYKHYNGDFDKYLIDQFKASSMSDVEAAIQKEAEETVQEILLIYVLVEAVGENEVKLTKEEKKNLKQNLKNTALLYQQYGLAFSYNEDDYLHAEQFDKVMNYLLEEKDTEGNVVEYKHIKYTATTSK